jgi:hypothetical protein
LCVPASAEAEGGPEDRRAENAGREGDRHIHRARARRYAGDADAEARDAEHDHGQAEQGVPVHVAGRGG